MRNDAMPRRVRTREFLLPALAVLAIGCGSEGGGAATSTGPTGSAGAADSPCNPTINVEGCYGQERMLCDNGTGTWQIFDECSAPMECAEAGLASLPGAYSTVCELPPPPVTADAVGGGAGGGGDTGNGPPPSSTEAVCQRWNGDRASLSEGQFSGSVAACDAGDISQDAKDNMVKLVNLYRWLCNLPAVTRDAAKDADAQACAIIMAANGKLSHTPSEDWKCWTPAGADAAKKSNISTAPGVTSVDRYMVDSGAHNHDTLGHRRWILSRTLGPIGVGSTGTQASCLHVIGGKGNATGSFVGWPPAGKVPLAAFAPYGKESIDSTGWSVQSDGIIMTKAQVKLTDGDGTALQIEQWPLGSGYGSKYAVGFRPVGWKTEAGKTYHVEVGGIPVPFSYDVEVVDCK